MEFMERSIKVTIDTSKCPECESKACVAACKLFARGILVVKDGIPALGVSGEEAKRLGTECLGCEYECWFRGKSAIKIEAPTPGLDEYRRKHGLPV